MLRRLAMIVLLAFSTVFAIAPSAFSHPPVEPSGTAGSLGTNVPAAESRVPPAIGATGTADLEVTSLATATGALLCLQDLVPEMIPDVRYATTNNFTGKRVYDSDRLWLRPDAARALRAAAVYAKTRYGVRFKVFDAYRPLSVQKKFWAIMPDPAYVADPKTGSRHNRGAAVDLTLVGRDGKDLDMGTGFDDFSPRAAWAAKDIPAEARKNRETLKQILEKFGFKPLPSEWWHYDYQALMKAPILDLPID